MNKKMENPEKANLLIAMLSEDVPKDIATKYILEAEEIVINRMYPFGTETHEVPKRYERIQIQIAAELYSKRGAEGQLSHFENGINRQWENGSVSSSLLKMIVPHCGSVEI